MKSGNYELSVRGNHTHKFNTKKGAKAFWEMMSQEKSNTFDRRLMRLKVAKIVKATYRLSQTYFNSFEEFCGFIKKSSERPTT